MMKIVHATGFLSVHFNPTLVNPYMPQNAELCQQNENLYQGLL